VLRALAAYCSGDGGHGHALKPNVRGPFSETTSTLHALEVLDELVALANPLADVADWVADPRRSAVRAANRGGRRYRAVGSVLAVRERQTDVTAQDWL
jgi:hypothetical protein